MVVLLGKAKVLTVDFCEKLSKRYSLKFTTSDFLHEEPPELNLNVIFLLHDTHLCLLVLIKLVNAAKNLSPSFQLLSSFPLLLFSF